MAEPPVVLFDGVCNLCEEVVQRIIRNDPQGVFRFAPLQSVAAERALKAIGAPVPAPGESLNTLMLIQDGQLYTCSEASLRIAAQLRQPWPLLRVFRAAPRSWRDAGYRVISRNRFRWWGTRDTCMVPTPALQARFLPGADQLRA